MVQGRGYQPKLPLNSDGIDGPYILTNSFNENARQNIKMIILTEQGEKLTDIEFGCGLRRFLFEQETMVDVDEVTEQIEEQITLYAPYIQISDIQVVFPQEYALGVKIDYVIVPTNTTTQDIFEVTI
tara:strand:+ start:29447 stop:29827 length:381 start_codon:yes stop_codon:yes gene_type:complete